jgi:hypothetical protein
VRLAAWPPHAYVCFCLLASTAYIRYNGFEKARLFAFDDNSGLASVDGVEALHYSSNCCFSRVPELGPPNHGSWCDQLPLHAQEYVRLDCMVTVVDVSRFDATMAGGGLTPAAAAAAAAPNATGGCPAAALAIPARWVPRCSAALGAGQAGGGLNGL